MTDRPASLPSDPSPETPTNDQDSDLPRNYPDGPPHLASVGQQPIVTDSAIGYPPKVECDTCDQPISPRPDTNGLRVYWRCGNMNCSRFRQDQKVQTMRQFSASRLPEPSSTTAELKDLLDVYERCGFKDLARAAIEQLFSRLTRMAGTPCALCGKLGDYDEMVCYEDEPAHPACVRLTARCIDAESLLPTAEEAEALLWELDRDEEHPYFTAEVAESISSKLKAISALRSTQRGDKGK